MDRSVRSMIALCVGASALACGGRGGPCDTVPVQEARQEGMTAFDGVVAGDVSRRLARFAPVGIEVDDALITPELRPVLQKLVQASVIIDDLYFRQVSAENPELRARLAADRGTRQALAYFDIMYGPWDMLEEGVPFVGTAPRRPGATFYPPDLTAEQFRAYVDAHPDQREALTSYFTVIRREGQELVAVPYSEAYRDHLEQAAQLLREAADLSRDERLDRYLRARADAFLSNDYRPSDEAWLELGDCPIEVVIGPYEVYNDELMGMRASFESFVTLRDPAASQQLARVSELSPDLERALPIEDRLRNLNRGDTRPISVVYVIGSWGDTRAGVQTLAFNLPNDEITREQHGYKLVLLRNVMEAKYQMILVPIARRLLQPELIGDLSFDAFLNNTLMHESAHGLGPGRIHLADGTETDVNQALGNLYSTIEEAKADIVGLFASLYLIDRGELPRELERQLYATFLAGFFRSVRFGATEAHGRANMIQFNFLMERQAIERTADGTYRVNPDRVRDAVRDLSHELLTIEGEGDAAAAQRFIDRYSTVSEALQQDLGRLTDIPTDIWPSYPAADRLLHD
jgi:hypothetical protein